MVDGEPLVCKLFSIDGLSAGTLDRGVSEKGIDHGNEIGYRFQL